MSKFTRTQKILIGLICFFLAVGLLFQGMRQASISDIGYSVFSYLKYGLIDYPLTSIKNFASDFSNLWKVQEENDYLKEQLSMTQNYKAMYENQQRENKELQELLEMNDSLDNYERISATVIGRDISYWNDQVTLDVGEKDGIKENMVVVNSQGVVGKVYKVQSSTCIVKLLTCEDKSNKVAVRINFTTEDDEKNEKKDFIEWYVVEQTVEYVLTPERIEYIASELVAQYKKDCGIDRIKAYEKQLDRIKAEISRLVDTLAVCPAAARQPIFDKMEQLDAEKQEAELDLSKLRISAKIQISKEHIADWLKQFCNGDALDVDFQKRIIDTFINSVYLYDDKVIIYYNIEGGKQVSYIDMIDSTEEPPFSDDAPGSSGGSDLKRPALAEHLKSEHPRYIFVNGLFGIVCKR